FSAPIHFCVEILVLTPLVVQFLLDRLRIIGFSQFFTHFCLSPCTPSLQAANRKPSHCLPPCSRNFHSCIRKRPLQNVKGEISAVPPYFICTVTYISQVL